MSTVELYAESLMFQSPSPKDLPIPVFEKSGKFKKGPWPKKQDKTRTPEKVKKNKD